MQSEAMLDATVEGLGSGEVESLQRHQRAAERLCRNINSLYINILPWLLSDSPFLCVS